MAAAAKAKQCPYCRETLKPGAMICRHCDSDVTSAMDPHGGTCPWCRESISKDALKCRHCRKVVSATPVPVGTKEEGDCGCGGDKDGGTTGGTGTLARAYSGCGSCKILDFGISGGRYLMGYRTCYALVPIRISPSGVITYQRYEWTERCRAYDLETSTEVG